MQIGNLFEDEHLNNLKDSLKERRRLEGVNTTYDYIGVYFKQNPFLNEKELNEGAREAYNTKISITNQTD